MAESEGRQRPILVRLEELLCRLMDEIEQSPTRTILKMLLLIAVTTWVIRSVRRMA